MSQMSQMKKQLFMNGSLFSCPSCKSYNPAPAQEEPDEESTSECRFLILSILLKGLRREIL